MQIIRVAVGIGDRYKVQGAKCEEGANESSNNFKLYLDREIQFVIRSHHIPLPSIIFFCNSATLRRLEKIYGTGV